MLPFPTSHTKNDIHFSLFLSFWGHSEAVIVAYNEWKNEWTLIFLVCVMNKILLVLIMKCSYLTFNWHRLKFYFWYLELCLGHQRTSNQLKVQAEYIYIIFFFCFWFECESGISELEICPGRTQDLVGPLKSSPVPYSSCPPIYTLLNSMYKFLQDNLHGSHFRYWPFVDSLNKLE